MDLFSILRMLGALLLVLGMLGACLWAVRRFDIRLPGRTGGLSVRRLEIVEREVIDTRRSVTLIRRDGREHLILLSPEGNLVVESGIIRDAVDEAAMAEKQRKAAERQALNDAAVEKAKNDMRALRQSFADLVDAKSKDLGTSLNRARTVAEIGFQKATGGALSLQRRAGQLASKPAVSEASTATALRPRAVAKKPAAAVRQPVRVDQGQAAVPMRPRRKATGTVAGKATRKGASHD
jgi:flagellar biogenesis protein FliO